MIGHLLAFLAIAVADRFRIVGPGLRASSPLAVCAALAYTLSVARTSPDEPRHVALALVAAVLALVTGSVVQELTSYRGQSRRAHLTSLVGRVVAVTVSSCLYGWLATGDGPLAARLVSEPRLNALVMLGVLTVGLVLDLVVTSLPLARRGFAAWRRRIADETRSSLGMTLGVMFMATVIAMAAPDLQAASVLVFTVPMIFIWVAWTRYLGVRQTYREGIAALSQVTEISGHTRPGHARLVADLSVRMGRDQHLSARELVDLEYAGLLHDIGQVALPEPIPQGSTTLAAPVDQRRIQHDTVHIVRETGVLDSVADILAHQVTPFRNMRELGEEIPLASRILKAANAAADLLPEAPTRGDVEAAIERLHLGLGYEYDPMVVASLERVIDGAVLAAPLESAGGRRRR